MRTKTYTFPPDAVYRAGKKKEHATKALRALDTVLNDISDSRDSRVKRMAILINDLMPALKNYRSILDE